MNKKLLKIHKVKKKSSSKDKKRLKIKKKKIRKVLENKSSEKNEKTTEDPRKVEPSTANDDNVPCSEEKNINILSNFTETFQKFKKSYLSRNGSDVKQAPSKVKKITTLENWTTIMKESKKKQKESEEAPPASAAQEKQSEIKEETCLNNNVRTDNPGKKAIHEKFVVTENYHYKKEIVKDGKYELYEEDFSQYKHKKIRRTSKDSEVDSSSLAPLAAGDNQTAEQAEDSGNTEKFAKFKKKVKSKKNKSKVKKEENEPTTSSENPETKTEKKKKRKKDKRGHKERNEKKKKIAKQKESEPECPPAAAAPLEDAVTQQPVECTLTEADLVDGLRILKRVGAHFYPGRLTEISPPDVYGIVVDRERGNKPHIFSQEEVLTEAVREVRPVLAAALQPGRRVCAYWSQQMSFLHPGSVTGPDTTDPDYVVIQLDDGDSRDIHIGQVRYLPEQYPHVAPDQDSITELFGTRKRVAAAAPAREKPAKASKVKKDENKERHRHNSKSKDKKKRHKESEWSVVSVTEIKQQEEEEKSVEPAAPATPVPQPADSDGEAGTGGGTERSPIAAFLPAHAALWRWADDGWRVSPKSRRVYHTSIVKEDAEVVQVGDCAVFLSTSRPDRPYIGRIHSLWQTTAGNKKVQVKWFYHPAEVEGSAEGGGRVEDIKEENALFASSHTDENDVQTISHKCSVLEYSEYRTRCGAGEAAQDGEDLYFLAGQYDPVLGTIVFMPGVI